MGEVRGRERVLLSSPTFLWVVEIHTLLDVLAALPAPDKICFAAHHEELQEGQIHQAKE